MQKGIQYRKIKYAADILHNIIDIKDADILLTYIV